MKTSFTIKNLNAKIGNDEVQIEELTISGEATPDEIRVYGEIIQSLIEKFIDLQQGPTLQ